MNTPPPIVDSVDDLAPQLANNRAYWLGWGSSSDVDDELPIYRSDLPHAMLNGVLRARGVDIDAAVGRARQALKGTGWLWWYHPVDSDADVADLLVARGATLAGAVPLMAARLADVPDIAAPAGVRIEPARTDGELAAFARTYLVPNGLTMDEADAAAEVERARDDRFDDQHRYLAWIGDEPVACGALSISHGVAGVYNMATRAEYESRGIATALAVRLLREARGRGLKVATLTASARGALVYRRLGFTNVSEYQLFSL
ncbi:GNAT family N-acetyltransferase [Actinoplanes sp. NPDC048796]|uniref:GNAT family N-acetyltransferase n=1 Tax=unclassified Actinoplanes TaxID=2626549 RepID=UPI0033F19BC4